MWHVTLKQLSRDGRQQLKNTGTSLDELIKKVARRTTVQEKFLSEFCEENLIYD